MTPSLLGPEGMAMWILRLCDTTLRSNWRRGKKTSKVCRKESLAIAGPEQGPKLQLKTGSGQQVESLSFVQLYRNKWSFYLETSMTRKRAEKHKLGLTCFLYQVKEKSYKQVASTGHWFQGPVNTPIPSINQHDSCTKSTLLIYSSFICCVCMCHRACMAVRDWPRELVLPFHHVGPGGQAWLQASSPAGSSPMSSHVS